MTELEFAKQGLACASAVWDDHYERAGIPVPAWVGLQLGYWQTDVKKCERRVAELEAAEKDGPVSEVSNMRFCLENVVDRLDALESCMVSAKTKIEKVRKWCATHQHKYPEWNDGERTELTTPAINICGP